MWAVLTASDHPRIRGEHATKDPGARVAFGSSPHTRGARSILNNPIFRIRIIPAYAGSTLALRQAFRSSRDHPRIRGEHSTGPGTAPSPTGSSPHTRGAQPLFLAERRDGRIIPAYAGSTDGLPIAEWRRADHPRIRGEHDYIKRAPEGLDGSSPHTRGAQ